ERPRLGRRSDGDGWRPADHELLRRSELEDRQPDAVGRGAVLGHLRWRRSEPPRRHRNRPPRRDGADRPRLWYPDGDRARSAAPPHRQRWHRPGHRHVRLRPRGRDRAAGRRPGLRITYKGGDGNDVVLTAVALPTYSVAAGPGGFPIVNVYGATGALVRS